MSLNFDNVYYFLFIFTYLFLVEEARGSKDPNTTRSRRRSAGGPTMVEYRMLAW